VNGVAQHGLVRFAVPSAAPNKQGPMVSGANFKPTLTATSSVSVRVSWTANWDRDDQVLTYHVTRNGATVYTTSATSQFWNRPTLTFADIGLSPNTTYSYRINASDPSGNLVWGDTVSITTP
jgi:chitodextrinase